MYSPPKSTSIRVLRLRGKDKHGAWLSSLAREVNTVFNYCNELSIKVFERERRFLSGFDFWPFLKGSTRGECGLNLLSTRLLQANGQIVVGNVNASVLAKTHLAKSVLDAGWSAFRTMLRYKCADAGVWFDEVNEAFSTQTCSVCKSRTGPKGREGLGMRGWQCSVRGAIHDRDVNAAQNILAAGHRRLAEGISGL
jgi:transposase